MRPNFGLNDASNFDNYFKIVLIKIVGIVF